MVEQETINILAAQQAAIAAAQAEAAQAQQQIQSQQALRSMQGLEGLKARQLQEARIATFQGEIAKAKEVQQANVEAVKQQQEAEAAQARREAVIQEVRALASQSRPGYITYNTQVGSALRALSEVTGMSMTEAKNYYEGLIEGGSIYQQAAQEKAYDASKQELSITEIPRTILAGKTSYLQYSQPQMEGSITQKGRQVITGAGTFIEYSKPTFGIGTLETLGIKPTQPFGDIRQSTFPTKEYVSPKQQIINLGKEIIYPLAQVGQSIGSFYKDIGIQASIGGLIIPKEAAIKTYKLSEEEYGELYSNKGFFSMGVTKADIVKYKMEKGKKPLEYETYKPGKLGTAIKIGAELSLFYPLLKSGISSYKLYRATGATKAESTLATSEDILRGFSPLQMNTGGSKIAIRTGAAKEIKSSPELIKTMFPEKGGIISQFKTSRIWEIPTRVQVEYAPTLAGKQSPKVIKDLVSYQIVSAKGKVETLPFGRQFSSTISGTRDVVGLRDIITRSSKFGVETTKQLTAQRQIFSGIGTTQFQKAGIVTTGVRGKPIRVDINKLSQDVIRGLTETKVSFASDRASYVLSGREPFIGFGKGDIKFRNLYRAVYTAPVGKTPSVFTAKFIPAGRPGIARGISITAPESIKAEIIELPTTKGKTEFIMQLTKGRTRAALFGSSKPAIAKSKTAELSIRKFEPPTGGGGSVEPSIDIGGVGGGVSKFGDFSDVSNPFRNLASKSTTNMFSDITTTPIYSQIPFTKSAMNLKLLTIPISGQSAITKQIISPATSKLSISIPITSTRSLVSQIANSATSTSTALTSASATATATTTAQITTPLTLTTTTNITTSIPITTTPKIRITPPGIFPIPRGIKPSTKSKLFSTKKLYRILSKRKGKWFELAKGLPRGKAELIGTKYAKRTLARSFRLEEIGVGDIEDIAFKTPRREFRLPKARSSLPKDTFVQIKALSRGSPEVSEIMSLKRSKSKKGKLKWL